VQSEGGAKLEAFHRSFSAHVYRRLEAASRLVAIDVGAQLTLNSQSLSIIKVIRGACLSPAKDLQAFLDFARAAKALCEPRQETT
jgi:hypothetical protein